MKWDPAFKTVDPPRIVFVSGGPTEAQKQNLMGYRDIRISNPGWESLPTQPSPKGQEAWLDHQWRWSSQSTPVQKGECKIQLICDSCGINETKESEAFCKITHLLDPIRWIKGKYSDTPGGSPENQKAFKTREEKLKDPMNQAYIEALSYYCCSRLRERDISPHFPFFYGSFCAEADSYKFNITDDFDHYRNMKWFWEGFDKKTFTLNFENAEHETESEKAEWTRRPSFLEDDDSDMPTDSEDDESSGDESLQGNAKEGESGSIHSADDLSFHTGSESDTNSDSDYTEPSFSLTVENFPVMLMYLEKSDGVMDDLLNHPELLSRDPGTPEWHAMWSAWIFQIIAALCVAQHTLSMTHNDLHSNNIVYTDTDQEYLYYQKRDGTTWKIPTYGKIFRIIDFGRAIFRLKQKVIFSDDFREGNDAATQYNFGALRDTSRGGELGPNPSFDLARLAVSVFEGLFPDEPEKRKGGKVLSSEEGLVVRETDSDLFNVMWTWMVTDFGENILINAAGEEKYPDFDLYNVIAEQCHDAVPAQQVDKKPFSHFKVPKAEVPQGQKVYSLFF
jgi:hypothetical protein